MERVSHNEQILLRRPCSPGHTEDGCGQMYLQSLTGKSRKSETVCFALTIPFSQSFRHHVRFWQTVLKADDSLVLLTDPKFWAWPGPTHPCLCRHSCIHVAPQGPGDRCVMFILQTEERIDKGLLRRPRERRATWELWTLQSAGRWTSRRRWGQVIQGGCFGGTRPWWATGFWSVTAPQS